MSEMVERGWELTELIAEQNGIPPEMLINREAGRITDHLLGFAVQAIAATYGEEAQAVADKARPIDPEEWRAEWERLCSTAPPWRVRRTGERPAGTYASRRRWGW